MPRKILILLYVLISISISSSSFAETVHLKNGKKVKGAIKERTKNYIKIISGDDQPNMFFIDEIEKIVEDDIEELTLEELVKKEERPLSAIPQSKVDLVLRLLEYNGVRANIIKTFKDILEGLPPEQRETYRQYFDVNEVLNEAIPIYDKYYSEDELIAMVNFYNSPAGQKLINTSSVAIDETMKKMIQYFSKKMKK